MFFCSFLYFIPDLLYGSVLSLVLLYTRIFYCLFLDNESSYFSGVHAYIIVFDADRSTAIKGICF